MQGAIKFVSHYFQIIMVILDVAAATLFLIAKKPAFAWYWLSAASISLSTMWLK